MNLKYLTKRSRLSQLCWFIVFLWPASLVFAQTPLPCGQPVAGSISAVGQENRYTFTATQGDVITLRLVSTTSVQY